MVGVEGKLQALAKESSWDGDLFDSSLDGQSSMFEVSQKLCGLGLYVIAGRSEGKSTNPTQYVMYNIYCHSSVSCIIITYLLDLNEHVSSEEGKSSLRSARLQFDG